MTLEEMQQAKKRTQDEIRAALNEFMRSTGLAVRDVRMETIEATRIGQESEYVVGELKLDVRL